MFFVLCRCCAHQHWQAEDARSGSQVCNSGSLVLQLGKRGEEGYLRAAPRDSSHLV
jgi:hypothetical protein